MKLIIDRARILLDGRARFHTPLAAIRPRAFSRAPGPFFWHQQRWLEGSFQPIYKDAKPTHMLPLSGDAEYRGYRGLPPREDVMK